MKLTPLVLIAAFMLILSAYGKGNPVEQNITAIDYVQSTVTIATSQHGQPKTYRLGALSEIFINGVKASIRELAVDMKVTQISLSDPATIAEIKASDTPNTEQGPLVTNSMHSPFGTTPLQVGSPSTQTAAEVTSILISGPWLFSGKGWWSVRAFKSDGTFTATHNPDGNGTWHIANGMLVLSFADWQDRILLPIDQNGGHGLNPNNYPMTMRRQVEANLTESRESEKPKKIPPVDQNGGKGEAMTMTKLPAQELASGTDPIVGRWVWNDDLDVNINADGSAEHPGQAIGGWKLLHNNKTVERDYEFVWKTNKGKAYIETMVLSTDCQRLDGANQQGARIWAKRIN